MTSKTLLKTNYAVEARYDAYFTGQHVQVASDGGSVVCECGDGVGVVSLSTGKVTGRIQCPEDQVTALALAPDDSTLVLALKSTSLQQYSWPGLDMVRSFRSYHRGPVTVMAWDSTSTLLLTAAADSSARVWDLHKKYCTHSLKGASGVFGAAIFHPDLRVLPRVYGAAGNIIHVWGLEAGSSTVVETLDGHHSAVTAIQLTHDTKHLVSCGLDRVIILWDMETFTTKKVVAVMESLSGLCLQPPGIQLPGSQQNEQQHILAMVVGDKGIPSVWEVDNGREVWRAAEPVVTAPDQEGVTLVNQLSHCPALDSFIMTTYDHSILLARTPSMEVWKQLAGYNDQILECVFVGSGESHLVVATNSIQLRLYDCDTFNCCLLSGHTALVLALAVHPTLPDIFASSSHDNTVLMWRLRTDGSADYIASAVGHTLSVGCVAFTQDFLITGSKDTCIKKWTVGKKVYGDVGKDGERASLPSTYTEKAHDKDINALCISVNGKLIATASQDKTAKIWSSDTLGLVGTLRGHKKGLWAVQFSPVDEILATASSDATIRIWTIADCANAATLEGHSVSVLRVHWLSQGLQLLSSASDGLVKLWNIRTRQCSQTYDEHEDKVWALAVSRDEGKVVTGGEDARLVLWKDVTEQDRQKAQEEADRLAADEQTLANLMKDKKWTKALRVAIGLGQPFRALKVMKELLDENPDQLSQVLARLRRDQLASLLNFMAVWNTKTKNSREAQSILKVLLTTRTPEELEGLDGWRSTLESLLPYTERHFKRVSALHQSASILSYMTGTLSLPPLEKLSVSSLTELDLLRTIPFSIYKEKAQIVEEKQKEDEEERGRYEEGDNSTLKTAVQNSIMEVDVDEMGEDKEEDSEGKKDTQVIVEGEESDGSEEDEGIEEGSDGSEDRGDSPGRSGQHIPEASRDDLGGNFIQERILASDGDDDDDENDDDEEEEEEEEEEVSEPVPEEKSRKRRPADFSIDQLYVESDGKKRKRDNLGGKADRGGGRGKGRGTLKVRGRGRGKRVNTEGRVGKQFGGEGKSFGGSRGGKGRRGVPGKRKTAGGRGKGVF